MFQRSIDSNRRLCVYGVLFCALLAVAQFTTTVGAQTPAEAADGSAQPIRLKVMTFNMLCSFCDRTNYDSWEDRLGAFRDIFERHNPDLIGAQELVKKEEVAQILDMLPEFEALYLYDPDRKTQKEYPDATILYRTDRFELIENGYYWLTATPDEPWTKGWASFQLWRLVAWAHLREKTTGRELYFATTHFDNNRPNQENSAPLFVERTAQWAGKIPCIVVGDFNSKPDSPAYATLTDPETSPLKNTFDLAPKWRAAVNQDPPPDYDPAHRIDHLFVGGPAEFKVHDWVVDQFVYGERDRYPSDHRAMVVDVEF